MIIKHIDSMIQNGQFDIDSSSDVSVYLAEITGFTEDKGLVEWQIVGEADIPIIQLHYDDTADGGNKYNTSWAKFYASHSEFGEKPLFTGSEKFYKNGTPNFGGVAKASSYLKYSSAFISWLESFDLKASTKIKEELPLFDDQKRFKDGKYEGRSFKESIWYKFKAPRGKWFLPVICTLSSNKRIVFGLKNCPDTDWEELENLQIDIEKSLEIMSFFEAPVTEDKEVISELFQMGKGLGRNPFGKKIDLATVKNAEYIRLMGTIPISERSQILEVWAKKCSYKIKVTPNPDKSELLYLPEGDVKFSELESFNREITERRTNYFANKKTKKSEDSENIIKERLPLIPVPQSARVTLYLTSKEGSQKEKLIIQQIFSSVSLDYFAALDAEIMSNNTQNIIVGYMKKALTAQDRETPSVYLYWTKIFTAILQKKYISAYEVFNNFQRFCKSFSADDLINKGKARDYFYVIGKLKRLQQFVYIARKNSDIPCEIETILEQVEKNSITSKGVFGMKKELPTITDYISEVYDDLKDYQQEKINAFMSKSWSGVPSEDFRYFIRGGLIGILLNELTWLVKNEGRQFSVTAGRHPSTLRGKDIQKIFEKGIGLLIGLDKQHRFNGKAALFIQACMEESRKDAFNSGLIMGLVFNYKTKKDIDVNISGETKND